MPKHLFERASGRFVAGGYMDLPTFDAATHGVVELAEFPNYQTQRWDAQAGALRDATPEELAADTTTRREGELEALAALKALAQVTWNFLPAATRPATFQEFWTAVKARYRALVT